MLSLTVRWRLLIGGGAEPFAVGVSIDVAVTRVDCDTYAALIALMSHQTPAPRSRAENS
jgi:hypothetical protein